MVFARILDPDGSGTQLVHSMVTDLRSGGMAGGSGEQVA
jgi:hypothetical protein